MEDLSFDELPYLEMHTSFNVIIGSSDKIFMEDDDIEELFQSLE
jgi:hypothetical protein